ncbi:MAG: type II toxin-antitoxin system HicA family toxin, partial [Chlamydiia bacterium]|nr:type II toxin-antitoxin system HicA family toxin [Chlamydiia bacterium]
KEKLIARILNNQSISYDEAEKLLQGLGFELEVRGSHHVFRKIGYQWNVTLKRRRELLPYQMRLLQ